MMNSRRHRRIKPALDEIVDQRLHRRGVLRRAFDEAERMLVALRIDADRCDQESYPHPYECRRSGSPARSSSDKSDAIHSFICAAESATKRREAADFDSPAPPGAGTSPSGSRTERLKCRVETLISIWFIAHLPSKSSADRRLPTRQRPFGLHRARAAEDARSQSCRRGSRSCLWSAPSGAPGVAHRARGAGRRRSVASCSIISLAPQCPTARKKRSKLADMLASASAFKACVGIAVDVLCSLHGVAFLSWNRHPEPNGSRRATPLLSFSTFARDIPHPKI